MRIAVGNNPALPKPAKNSGHTCGLLRSPQRSDKPGPQYPQVLGLQPKFARLRLHGGTFALDIAQVSIVGRVFRGSSNT